MGVRGTKKKKKADTDPRIQATTTLVELYAPCYHHIAPVPTVDQTNNNKWNYKIAKAVFSIENSSRNPPWTILFFFTLLHYFHLILQVTLPVLQRETSIKVLFLFVLLVEKKEEEQSSISLNCQQTHSHNFNQI